MGRFIDLAGQKFGRLTIVKRVNSRKSSGGHTRTMWLCKCDCGKEVEVAYQELKNKSTQSCGCYQKERRSKSYLDLAGQKFGRWSVLKKVEKPEYLKSYGVYWLCKCDCGNEKIVVGKNLLNGISKSCGCYQKEKASNAYLKNLIGKRFGRLMVINRAKNYINPSSGRVRTVWACMCDCGKEVEVALGELMNEDTQSCGCLQKERTSKAKLEDLVGKKFGRLLVIQRASNQTLLKGQEIVKWVCLCDCGNKKEIAARSLKSGATKSCGCQLESFIASELKKYFVENYDAKTEYKILKNPKTGRWLPYDIYISGGKIPEANGIYVEINGKQHYEITWYYKLKANKNNTNIEEEFKNRKKLDKIKKKFANNNGIYIEIDIRKIKSIEQTIKNIKNVIKSNQYSGDLSCQNY
jgi:hypothetical protein